MSEPSPITVTDILAAQTRIAQHVRWTPLAYSHVLSQSTGAQVYLKLECWQQTGSFKVRGALNRLATLAPDAANGELVTASAGNHALGVAYAAARLGYPNVRIFLPKNAPQSKVKRLGEFPVRLVFEGKDYEAAHAAAEAYVEAHGALYIHAYEDPAIIAGQGTVGLEIMQDLPDTDAIVAPVGGGGLSAGIALVAKALNPDIQIFGVQPEASPSAFASFRDGRAHEHWDAEPTIADGLAGGYGRLPFEIARRYVEGILVVAEKDVRRAVVEMLAQAQVLAEGSAAITLAPLLTGALALKGKKKVVLVISGGNIDAGLVRQLLNEAAV